MEENEKDAAKLLLVVLDRHTTLRMFGQCRYTAQVSIVNMVNDSLTKLTSRNSIPPDSLSILIAYIDIAQGGLGPMDAHTRAVPDFVLTVS